MTADRSQPLKRWQRKELVQSLRRHGLSYREILQQLPFALSKSTLSAWCKDIELTPEQLDRLERLFRHGSYRGRLIGPRTTQRRRAEEIAAIRKAARAEVRTLTQEQQWIAGLMLYWAEGTKDHEVSISNSDPRVIAFMMRRFREFLHIPERRFRAQLHLQLWTKRTCHEAVLVPCHRHPVITILQELREAGGSRPSQACVISGDSEDSFQRLRLA